MVFFLVVSGNILYFFIVIEFCFTINFTGVLVPWMYNTKNLPAMFLSVIIRTYNNAV